MNRNGGFYWVKARGKWEVAEFVTDANEISTFSYWRVYGHGPGPDSMFEEIDENRIVRTVNKEPNY